MEAHIPDTSAANIRSHNAAELLTTTLGRLAAAPDRNTLFAELLTALQELLAVPSGSFWEYDPLSKSSTLRATTGDGPGTDRMQPMTPSRKKRLQRYPGILSRKPLSFMRRFTTAILH
jgi:hypothetical protein